MGSSIFNSEVNNSIFKLVGEGKGLQILTFLLFLRRLWILKIMETMGICQRTQIKKNHPFQKLCQETSTHHQWITVIYEIPCHSVWLTGQGRAPGTINCSRTAPMCNKWLICLFLASTPVIALLPGMGKNQAHLAPVSSSQIKGSFSNKWQIGWIFSLGSTFMSLLQVYISGQRKKCISF